ncbi:hypothetical protein [Streptomyces vinaceus]|uniref:hypothetical protein n=1 Tax=Streptomyces vinaceus TaxID=1960 RepID=UPI0036C192DF
MKTTTWPPEGATPPPDLADQLRRRREAAYRCPPLPCGHRDPLDCLSSPNGPSTYGLTEQELRQHANDLIRAGWSLDEILTRLDVQPKAATRQPWLTSDRMGVAA